MSIINNNIYRVVSKLGTVYFKGACFIANKAVPGEKVLIPRSGPTLPNFTLKSGVSHG